MKWLASALLAMGAAPADAQQANALGWLQDQLSYPTVAVSAGQWSAPTGEVLGIDPITLFEMDAAQTPITVPRGPARITGLLLSEGERRGAVLALVWSDAPVACGAYDLATIGVDTGLAAFIAPQGLQALQRYADTTGGNLFTGPYAEQIDRAYPGPFLPDLSTVPPFPIIGSGWGDGGYPVSSLHDADGNMVALYAQFIVAEGQDWLLPPPCASAAS